MINTSTLNPWLLLSDLQIRKSWNLDLTTFQKLSNLLRHYQMYKNINI